MAMNATVDIITAVHNGITRLASAYFTPPFKVANITEDKKAPALHLMLMSASPGILDGDEHAMRIELGEESFLQLHTQAYQRLFQMKAGASQTMEVRLRKGAAFCYLPHPSVPHALSAYRGINKIFLAGDCRLAWGEVLTCGRKLNGEVFAFSKYHSTTDLFMDDRLVLRENVFMAPASMPLSGMGQMEGYTHQASLLVMGTAWTEGGVQAMMEEYLAKQKDILYGISSGPAGSLVLRLLGHKAGQLHHILQVIAGQLFTHQNSLHVS